MDTKAYITEPARQVPLCGIFDVVVAGGGPAGFAAALAAARRGAKTLLLERNECLGGMWTAGLMPWIIDFQNKTGIMEELCMRLSKVGGFAARPNTYTAPPEELRHLLEQMCVESGVTLQYGTMVCGAISKQNMIDCIITESKSGRQAWKSRIFIDATGDGDLAAFAGCQFDYGNSENMAQPGSLVALLGGLDPKYIYNLLRSETDDKVNLKELMKRIGMEPSYGMAALFHFGCGIVGMMSNHAYGVKPFDAASRTEAVISCRDEIHRQIETLKKVPELKDLVLLGTAANLGIREGRRIKGRKSVMLENLQGPYPEKNVCISTFCIDVHAIDPSKCKSVIQERPRVPASGFGIPLESLISADYDNLLLAGRCISGDFFMHASYRVTGNAVPLGEAAGWAASEAVASNISPIEIKNIPCFAKSPSN